MHRSLLFKNALIGLIACLGIYVTMTGDISFSGPRYRAITYAEIMVEQAREVGTELASLEIPSVPVLVPDFRNTSSPNDSTQSAAPERMLENAAAPGAAGRSGERYFVQLASISDNDEIRAEVSRLSRAHAQFLDGKRLNLQRADLGSKGIFHRLLIGPFGARSEATQLCLSLKEAKRDCLVLKTSTDRVQPL